MKISPVSQQNFNGYLKVRCPLENDSSKQIRTIQVEKIYKISTSKHGSNWTTIDFFDKTPDSHGRLTIVKCQHNIDKILSACSAAKDTEMTVDLSVRESYI